MCVLGSCNCAQESCCPIEVSEALAVLPHGFSELATAFLGASVVLQSWDDADESDWEWELSSLVLPQAKGSVFFPGFWLQ